MEVCARVAAEPDEWSPDLNVSQVTGVSPCSCDKIRAQFNLFGREEQIHA